MRDTSGASAAEYALLLSIIGGSIALTALALGDSIACSIDRAATVVEGGTPAAPGHGYGKSNPGGNAFGHHNNQC